MRSSVSYSLQIKRSAARELAGLPQPARGRVIHAIDSLREQPLAGSPLKGDLRGLRRLRVGDYRVIYELLNDKLIVLVVRVASRQGAYRRRA